ncbi:MAG TPA: acylphosphatase [Roseiflexaceae bacterium]|nr:acylphosphatase [Roseiflexaceae bacterium]
MDLVRAHIRVSGRVQGVNFRSNTREQARSAGVSGWVRNLDDGRVEAVFEGPRSAVQRLVSWCYSGPGYARVERVEVEWQHPTGQEHGFKIEW